MDHHRRPSGALLWSFISPSDVLDLEMAVGQYNVYRDILSETGSKRVLHLAVPRHAYQGIWLEVEEYLLLGRMIRGSVSIAYIGFVSLPANPRRDCTDFRGSEDDPRKRSSTFLAAGWRPV